MDIEVCAQCGGEIESKGVRFRDRVFCSDECCDEFEEELSAQDGLEMEDLDELDDLGEDDLMSDSDQDLGYRSDEDDLDDFDDDFVVDDDDF